MAIAIVTDFRVLLSLASAVGVAKLSGDAEALREATKNHDDYRDLCLRADWMLLGVTQGDLT